MTKYSAMMVSWYEGLEDIIWGAPSATDGKTPHGISHWIQKGTTGQVGFFGLDPSGYATGRGNLLSTTYTRWANYFADYDTINGADLFTKMREGAMSIQFRSMLSHKEPTVGTGNGIYANKDTILAIEDELKGQNMNLGYDTDPTGGRGVFQGNKYIYAPKLDADTSNPIYMIDWKWMALGCMPGWENNLTKPYQVGDMHNVRRVDLDATIEFVSTDLRRQAVFATV
jgi:hypothetical protein